MSSARRLRGLLAQGKLLQMPCCYDALSARLIEEAGFPLTFVSGFGAAAAKGLPDTGLMSFGEMRDTMCSVAEALEATPRKIPCIGDGDTGYGNSVNAKRTVAAYAQAGMAGIMIEDQVCRPTTPAVQARGECRSISGGPAASWCPHLMCISCVDPNRGIGLRCRWLQSGVATPGTRQ